MREELQETSVDALFTRGEADRLLARPKAQEELEKICKSERGDHRLRVLAHELLLMLGKNPDPKMVKIYGEALSGAFMYNWWALPGHHLGKLGESFIRFGDAAIPHLVKEMDNPELMTTYLGPDAPICRQMRYCVGDLAAYLGALILDREFLDSDDPEERLKARMIFRDELQEKLNSEKNSKNVKKKEAVEAKEAKKAAGK